MPQFKTLAPDVLKTVAERVSSRLTRVFPGNTLGAGPISLHETIDVWMLGAEDVMSGAVDLEKLAVSTGRWHHQVKQGDHAIGYARTVGTDAASVSVVGVVQSELAKSIDSAIEWLDKNVQDPTVTVRLLSIPAFHTTAFWLADHLQRLLVVDALPQLDLRRQFLYEVKEFLDALRTVRPAPGLIFRGKG